MRKGIIFLISICFFTCIFSQDKTVDWECKQLSRKELNNISILSECYGYVRFFYPNPHVVKNFDWIKFLMHAIPEIERINTDDELKSSLLKLFSPICPHISFSTDSLMSTEKLPPPYFIVEHKAIGNLAQLAYGRKYSPIIEITDDNDYKNIYSYKLKENLYVNFPLAVKELPAKTKEFSRFKKEIDKIDIVLPATSPQSEEASKKYEYKLPQPVQIEIPAVFLIDEKTISFGETFAEMMKFYNVGTLVGTHTAGCNGDMTVFYDTYGYWYSMTYNKVLNRDGSQHHGVGVLPNINCEMQVSDIRNNIDTQLEKAKELLR